MLSRLEREFSQKFLVPKVSIYPRQHFACDFKLYMNHLRKQVFQNRIRKRHPPGGKLCKPKMSPVSILFESILFSIHQNRLTERRRDGTNENSYDKVATMLNSCSGLVVVWLRRARCAYAVDGRINTV